MKRTIFTLLSLVLLATGVFAQKIDQRLTGLVEQSKTRSAQGIAAPKPASQVIAADYNADGTVKALSAIATLEDGEECPTAQLEQMGITVRWQIGNRVALAVPADKLRLLEDVREFSFVRADVKRRPMNDVSRQATKADQITDATKSAAASLPKAYTGSGVVLGVIDQGIDFNHAAFRDDKGSTRIVRAMLFTSNDGKYTPYTPDEVATLTTDTNSGSHGTHTAAIAGGSETGNGQQGLAPQTDLFLVGLDTYSGTGNIAEAIKQIFNYATSVNKPAVVSISMGNVCGLHDGTDNIPYTVEQLTKKGTEPGRAVLVSSGNSAANWQSIVKGGEIKTVLGAYSVPTEGGGETTSVAYRAMYCFYASDYKDFDIQLKLVDVTTGAVSDLGTHVLDEKTGAVRSDFKLNKYNARENGEEEAIIYLLECPTTPVKMDEPQYRLAIIAKAGSGQTLKMISDGEDYAEPCFDAPNDGGYDFAANGWTKGNGDIAFCVDACNDAVISVGSYITRNEWTNYSGEKKSYPNSSLTGKKQQVGEISDFSSYGTDDYGKTYPTIIAPGQGIISAASSYDSQSFVNGAPNITNADAVATIQPKVVKNGRDNWYILEQGTSMSCPHAAGIVALWMQAKPTLNVNDIKSILKETCVNDEWTTTLANIPSGNKIQAGYGKIDALAGLKKILGTDGIEVIGADGRREATPATMYGVDAPVYNMMGQQVDKSHKGLVIYKGRKYVNK